MPVYNKVNEDKFSLVKKMLDAGVPKTQITRIVGLSNSTVLNIEQSVDLSDYREIVRSQFERKAEYDRAKAKAKNTAPKQMPNQKKSYTFTMVINVDAEHDNVVAPLTALISNVFAPENVVVEAQRVDN